MKQRKLNYRFHNPNTAAKTADYILKIMIEANEKKVEKAIQNTVHEMKDDKKCYEECSA